MKTKYMLFSLIAGMTMSLSACSSEGNEPEEEQPAQQPDTFIEAPKCSGTVSVTVYNAGDSRASSSFLEDNIDRFTATRVDTKNTYVLVSYHGREHENIGMVQMINSTDNTVLSEIVFNDARVNFAQFRNTNTVDGVAYIGVDRTGKDGVLCGIVAVPVINKRFVVGDDVEATLTPYKVEGVSINCIKQHNGDTNAIGNTTMVVASGGNYALGEDGLAGFTKFEINTSDPTKLGILKEEVAANYRGYWFSFGHNNGAPCCYTYRTVDEGDLVYKMGAIRYDDALEMFANVPNTYFISDYKSSGAEVEVYRQKGTTANFGRFTSIAIKKDGNKFILVSTGDKEGGIRAYRFDQDPAAGGPKLTLVDVWHKQGIALSTEVIAGGKYYIFVGSGDGVYKTELQFDFTDPSNKKLTMVPVAKRRTTSTTESGTLSSTNYLQVSGSGSNSWIHVAGGYEGYYKLRFNDTQFGTCDPRTVFDLD